jgi:hypothetical protein
MRAAARDPNRGGHCDAPLREHLRVGVVDHMMSLGGGAGSRLHS